MVVGINSSKINYFILSLNKEANRKAGAKLRQQLQKEFKDVFTEIGCFEGTFSLQGKPDRKP